MGFYDEEGFLANGATLFADDYQDKKTEVQCSVFSGFNKGSERIVTINFRKYFGCHQLHYGICHAENESFYD